MVSRAYGENKKINRRKPVTGRSGRNPELDKWLLDKPRIIILNKSDCADENITKQWVEYYKKKGIRAVMADCKSGKGVAGIIPAVKAELAELLERRTAKGIAGKPIRVMVVGIPNVGKSSLINKLAGSKRAKVEDRPGVTRGRQWVKISNELELLDMPGVLWPKFEDQTVGEHLAFTGAVKDDVIDIELLAMRLLQLLNRDYPQLLQERYKVDAEEDTEAYELLTVLDEYRSGKLGKISLEKPPKTE